MSKNVKRTHITKGGGNEKERVLLQSPKLFSFILFQSDSKYFVNALKLLKEANLENKRRHEQRLQNKPIYKIEYIE